MQIESYRFGHIVIDGQAYSNDVIIFPDHVMANWWRREGHELHPDDLEEVLAANPDVLVVGKGHNGLMQILPQTEALLRERGIEVVAQKTGAATETFNRLQGGDKHVVAALHLTC